MGVIYTGGREGTHGVIMCKPVGGGVVDIENVPIDQANLYQANGYYQCDGTGDSPTQVGYCIPSPQGYNCTPAPAGQPQQSVSFAGESSPIAPHNTLPDVGAHADILAALVIATIIGVFTAWKQKQQSVR